MLTNPGGKRPSGATHVMVSARAGDKIDHIFSFTSTERLDRICFISYVRLEFQCFMSTTNVVATHRAFLTWEVSY